MSESIKKYIGHWMISGSYSSKKIIDFEAQFKSELPAVNYSEIKKQDPELMQTLDIDDKGKVVFKTPDAILNGELSAKENDVHLHIDDEVISLKLIDSYLIFDIEDGYIFKRD